MRSIVQGPRRSPAVILRCSSTVSERQLTRVPSEIYPLAMLYGQALLAQNKFDEAAVQFAVALRQKSHDERAHAARNEALIKAGKPEAAQ